MPGLRFPVLQLASICLLSGLLASTSVFASEPDPVAERMLQAQTASGGWPKHLAGKAVDYARPFDAAASAALARSGRPDDATIDNDATTREIVHLAGALQRSGDSRYRDAALRGVDYLLAAQYANGGWPQFHPDRSGYRAQVTFNDDAMTQVVGLLQDIAEGRGDVAGLAPLRGEAARAAVDRAIALIVSLQVRIDGVPTIWAAQYDETTLVPATARKYEPPSLASGESVAIVRLLMRQPAPSPAIIDAIERACTWFGAHALTDIAIERDEASEGRPRDVRLIARPGARLWARFYDLERQQPLLVDRSGDIVASLADMSHERRTGYAWYGVWPARLLDQDLPAWRQRLATAHASAWHR
ncbi:pectate lyase [Luteimonas chenhongjianii]|uniref:Pectate lyase n=1 Tax=Luteimonas chenhongjianii TaxID=2006110 RepID=A0A290XID6_9GAMM|nr:pectate lyase [Luteimonas chenhongjianii]ATD68914.1 pectate lyase [Luteimonas chenhongjianii]